MDWEPHPDKEKMDALMPAIREYQELAKKHGIRDIFQDNGGKVLQTALITGVAVLPGRMGNDAYKDDREFELKSTNLDISHTFSTSHHLRPSTLTKYRSADWLFTMYRGIELVTIYFMEPSQLEPLFSKWETKWHEGGCKDLNDPRIRVSFVRQNGLLIHSSEKDTLPFL